MYNGQLYFTDFFSRDHITIHNCYYLLLLPKTYVKTRKYWYTNNMNMEKDNKFKKIDIKNRTCLYFENINKIEGFEFDNILLHEKSYENLI